MAPETLSIEEARRVALLAQGLRGPRSTTGGVSAMLRRLGAVQLDTISVLARSHELVAYARQGAIGRNRVERAYWGTKSATFEYWSHAACVVPLEDWPAYGFKRRARLARGRRWHVLEEHDKSCADVVARLRDDGPLTANQLGGAKKGGPWWDWSETKIAAEWLLDIGELVCRERRGFQRVYDLAERAVPQDLLAQDWTDEECALAARCCGRGITRRGDRGRPGRVPRVATTTRPAGVAVHRPPRGRSGRLDAARLRPSPCAGISRHAGSRPDRAPLTLRLPHLVPRAGRAALRSAPSTRGVHPEGEAGVRLLRHARARGHEDRGVGGPGTAGRRARGQAGDALASGRHRARGAGPGGGGGVGWLPPNRRRESGSRVGAGRTRERVCRRRSPERSSGGAPSARSGGAPSRRRSPSSNPRRTGWTAGPVQGSARRAVRPWWRPRRAAPTRD